VLAGIIDRVGEYGIRYREAGFDTLVRSIIYQQLSGRVASVILNRLLKVCGGVLTPGGVLKLRPARMRALGLSTAKTNYIRDLARNVRDGNLDFGRLDGMPDAEVIETLTQVKGIGEWTAHMFLMFALRRHNVLPTGDIGMRNAVRRAYGLEATPTVAEVERMAACWHPWCSVATWYLWRSIEGDANL